MTVGNHSLPSDIISTCQEGIFYCFAEWTNTVTQGFFWTAMLLAFCISLYIATSRLGTSRSFGFASFVGMIGAVWLAILGFMSWWIASLFIINGWIGFAVMRLSQR